MNDFLLILIGIFIIILIILVYILLAYVYNNSIEYKVEINKNLAESEETINITSKAFNTLQDSYLSKYAILTSNQNEIYKKIPSDLNILNTNILNTLNLTSNNIKIDNILNSNINFDNINFKNNITTYSNVNILTANDKYFNICNDNIDPAKRKCITMNIDTNNKFNIFPNKLIPESNIDEINIYNKNNGILANFNINENKILLGSNINPAILINNNVYTPNIIVCNYSFQNSSTPFTITLNFISNFDIEANLYINFMLYVDITLLGNTNDNQFVDKSSAIIDYNILKLKTKRIDKNKIITVILNIANNVNQSVENTTNGYITLS